MLQEEGSQLEEKAAAHSAAPALQRQRVNGTATILNYLVLGRVRGGKLSAAPRISVHN